MANLAAALEKEGISAFRFDFAGNGYVRILKPIYEPLGYQNKCKRRASSELYSPPTLDLPT